MGRASLIRHPLCGCPRRGGHHTRRAAPPKHRVLGHTGRMPTRDLHLAASDISEPRRLSAALKLTRTYATGGQRSVHEIYLMAGEREALVDDMRVLIEPATDRFLLIRLDPRSRVHTLGKALAPADPDYFYIG